MAKSKRSQAAAFANRNVRQGQPHPPESYHRSSTAMVTQQAIDWHWGTFPAQAKSFILNTPDAGINSLPRLVNFWSQPQNVGCLQGELTGTLCSNAWYLALVYLRMGMIREARALTVNGSFLHQCYNSSIEVFKRVLQESAGVHNQKLPYFFRGFNSIGSPQQMESYIRHYLPKEATQKMTSSANLSNASSMMGYINQISDDWNGSPSKNHQLLRSNDDGEMINIILEDDTSDHETHSFDIGSSTTLKALFNEYADQCDVSLRSLRFSFAGKALFLSNAGRKTPEQLGMKDQDVIKVHWSKAQESNNEDGSGQTSACTPSSKKKKAKKRSNKKTKVEGKRRQLYKQPATTLEECRIRHSAQLTKLHDEARPRFKLIRRRLNDLAIERIRPKARHRPAPKHAAPPSTSRADAHFDEGLGGKAGRSRFAVQVGEVQNLYKTSKRSAALASNPGPVPALDLHSCTREEALSRLNESLDIWVDEAMRGSYPFVKQAVIVCGCGSQTLSKTVEGWIRENARVSNAPSFRPVRQRGFIYGP